MLSGPKFLTMKELTIQIDKIGFYLAFIYAEPLAATRPISVKVDEITYERLKDEAFQKDKELTFVG